jgi:hypothetical protein
MGIEGIVPGTAFTLLTPQDSSFAVDLVNYLRLSNQPVCQSLEQLASSDPKWHRIKDKGFSGKVSGFAGLGSTGSAMAFTSEMLANQTKNAQHSYLSSGGSNSKLLNAYSKAVPSASSSRVNSSESKVNTGQPLHQPQQTFASTGTRIRGFVASSQSQHHFLPSQSSVNIVESSTLDHRQHFLSSSAHTKDPIMDINDNNRAGDSKLKKKSRWDT